MVTLKVKILRTLIEKSVGLIGVKCAYPIFFTTRWGIHTFGVRSPIDVLILDKGNHVVLIRHRLPPNRILFWNPIYNRVIELPPGTIVKRRITVDTQIASGRSRIRATWPRKRYRKTISKDRSVVAH